ncbi:MAG: NADP oxidoreductase, partial [Candidatus Brocadiia bacterium]
MSDRVRVGTIWLDACSGCHMSFLDMDERILDIAAEIEMVYGPLVDAKKIPDHVDVFLISGSVST